MSETTKKCETRWGHGCGNEFPNSKMERDHIIPLSQGGAGHPSNTQWLCPKCHDIKDNRVKKQYPQNRKGCANFPEIKKKGRVRYPVRWNFPRNITDEPATEEPQPLRGKNEK